LTLPTRLQQRFPPLCNAMPLVLPSCPFDLWVLCTFCLSGMHPSPCSTTKYTPTHTDRGSCSIHQSSYFGDDKLP
jgi:hypothetical protein